MLQRIITGYRNAFRGLPRNVWLLSLVLLVNRSGTMVLPRTRGRYMGLYASSFSVAFLVATLVGTALYQVDQHLVWYCSLVVAFVLLVGLLRLAQKPINAIKDSSSAT